MCVRVPPQQSVGCVGFQLQVEDKQTEIFGGLSYITMETPKSLHTTRDAL